MISPRHSLFEVKFTSFVFKITLSFCLPAIFDIFGKQDITQLEMLADSPDLPQQTTGDQTYGSMVRMLAVSSLSIIGLHVTSLLASSIIEREGPTWYFLSASALSLFLAVMIVADPANDHLRARGTRIILIVVIFSVDRFGLREISTTNDKWIHLPLLPDWM
ncbi:unnamed protein product [Dibothriocephalus latus]|uniref:Uncharacterized protein n=1 Tax=Dibothriocephalus latus TaxID=60516 RepID=A0A3P7P7K4_DIBLA|nr:unnamed protein product [Dibothriocephalus latus]